MGFDLLELPLETLDGYDLRRAREALEAEGLRPPRRWCSRPTAT